MWHPFLHWESSTLGWLLAGLSGMALILYVRREVTGRGLRNAVAPWGVASLRAARSADQCERILESWDASQREAARRLLLLDMYFVPVFSSALVILALFAAGWFEASGQRILHDAATVIAWGAWLAGAIDFAENTTLLRMVHAFPIVPERLSRLTGWLVRCKCFVIYMAVAVCFSAFL